MIQRYNKLVRDRIPEIIETSGNTCVTEILSDEDYLKTLEKINKVLAERGIKGIDVPTNDDEIDQSTTSKEKNK